MVTSFSGTTCETDINECSSNPCQNGATCTDKVNGYECTCTPDWMGTQCSVQYDACSPVFQNCKNGATCVSTPPSHDFSCTCVTGFTGDQCETNIDDCTPNPCSLPFVCFDEVNRYRCACPLGKFLVTTLNNFFGTFSIISNTLFSHKYLSRY